MVNLGLYAGQSTQESLELGFEFRQAVISDRLWFQRLDGSFFFPSKLTRRHTYSIWTAVQLLQVCNQVFNIFTQYNACPQHLRKRKMQRHVSIVTDRNCDAWCTDRKLVIITIHFIYNAPVPVLQKQAPSTVQLHTSDSIHSWKIHALKTGSG